MARDKLSAALFVNCGLVLRTLTQGCERRMETRLLQAG